MCNKIAEESKRKQFGRELIRREKKIS